MSDRTERLKASPPMFASKRMDRLSRVHHYMPLAIFVPVIVVLAALFLREQNGLALFGLVVGGYLLWTLTEYWMHRLIFHFEPEKGIGARFHWIIHGVHHEHPNDPMRLVMPPAASIPLALSFFGLFWLIFGMPTTYGLMAGFLIGYLIYDMTHFYLHHRTARSKLGKKLHELHMRHHFQDDTRGFGVSAPFWDVVFRTAPQHRKRHSASESSPS